jgi:hypothetical protein
MRNNDDKHDNGRERAIRAASDARIVSNYGKMLGDDAATLALFIAKHC